MCGPTQPTQTDWLVKGLVLGKQRTSWVGWVDKTCFELLEYASTVFGWVNGLTCGSWSGTSTSYLVVRVIPRTQGHVGPKTALRTIRPWAVGYNVVGTVHPVA